LLRGKQQQAGRDVERDAGELQASHRGVFGDTVDTRHPFWLLSPNGTVSRAHLGKAPVSQAQESSPEPGCQVGSDAKRFRTAIDSDEEMSAAIVFHVPGPEDILLRRGGTDPASAEIMAER
jgi:hypothetical protein